MNYEPAQIQTTPAALLAAARLMDALAREIVDLLDTAAEDADCKITLETPRAGDGKLDLAEALTARLIHGGWHFTYTDPDAEPERQPETPRLDQVVRDAAGAAHELIADESGDPSCRCGFKPVPPQAQTQSHAVALVRKHLQSVRQA